MPEHAHWEHFPHGADIGIRGFGPDMAEAFAQAAMALTALVTTPSRVQQREQLPIQCEGESADELFFSWIDALVFEMSTRRMLFSRFDVQIVDLRLTAQVAGEPVDRQRHEPAVEIKGPTFTELRVTHDPSRALWCAQCVVDV